MPIREPSVREERYYEIPASILDSPSPSGPQRPRRLSRYLFGLVILAAFGSMAYFTLFDQFFGEGSADDLNVEELVAEYEAAAARGAQAIGGLFDSGDRETSAEAAEGQVSLHVSSTPSGAQVEVDAQPVGTTPLSHRLTPGAYILTLRMPNYELIDTVVVFVEAGQEQLDFTLSESGSADERLASGENAPADPSQAEPPADTRTQRSPAAQTSPNVEPPTEFVEPNVEDGPQAEYGELLISSSPSGASAVLNGRYIGRTPITSRSTESGTYELRLLSDGYDTYEESILILPGERTSVHGDLSRRAGELSILVRPWGSIYVNGELQKADTDVRYTASLPAGEHTVLAVHPTLGSISREVIIRPGSTTSVTLDLESEE